jgi:subtilisin family serine protease
VEVVSPIRVPSSLFGWILREQMGYAPSAHHTPLRKCYELGCARYRPPFLLSLTLCVSYILGLNQAAADGFPIIDTKAWTYDAELTLPANWTTLQVVAHQADQGPNPLTYRWVKVGGPPLGKVKFSPNGNEYADITTASFSGEVAGTYTLRVIVADGLKESISEVEVSINPGRSDDSARDPRFKAESEGGRTGFTRVDHVIVRFETDAAGAPQLSAASMAVMDSLGATVSKTWLGGRFGLVELAPEARDRVPLESLLETLQALPEIRYAKPDHSIRLDYVPNDPLFDAQWGLENAAGVDIGGTPAWDQTTGSDNTLVAVMDSGIDYRHPDLYLAIAINNGEIPAPLLAQLIDTNSNGLFDFYDLNSLDANGDIVLDGLGEMFNQTLAADNNGNGYIDAADLRVPAWMDGIDGDSNGYVDDLTGWDSDTDSNDPMDTNGHGTHVAGIIAARGDNGLGVAGVNWRAQILPERFHNGDGGSISGAIQAIEHAVLLGADVINASWGTVVDNPALKEAIQWAGDKGVVVVVAAGNGSSDIDDPAHAYYPAAYVDLPNLISVASVDPSGSLSSFSNFGLNTVDLAAPGASIRSAGLGEDYVLWSGTSMATAHVVLYRFWLAFFLTNRPTGSSIGS